MLQQNVIPTTSRVLFPRRVLKEVGPCDIGRHLRRLLGLGVQ
jgi:hypothetical protein